MFDRQLAYKNLGPEKQQLLSDSVVCIAGIGALGTNAAELLIRSGIKNLILIDSDYVEQHNLQRQCLFDNNDLNKSKVIAAKAKLEEINPDINITIHNQRLNNINPDLLKSDIVLDCTDNIETRFLINEFCIKNNIPWIYSSAIESHGMVLVIYPNKTPCFSCIVNKPTQELGTCQDLGILNTIIRTIASIQVTECLKVLTNQEFSKELIYFDVWKNELIKTKIKKNKDCKVCQGINGKRTTKELIVKKCSSGGAYIIRPLRNSEINLTKIKNNFNVIAETPIVLIIQDKFQVSCYKNGKLMIKCDKENEAELQAERIYSIS